MTERADPGRGAEKSTAIWRAVALIVFLAIVQYFGTLALQRPWSWRVEMLISVSWWVAWLPFVPLVGFVAHRFGFERGRRFASTLAHATAATAIGLLHLSAVAGIEWVTRGTAYPNATFPIAFARFLGVPFLVFEMASYIAVAAVLVASSFARAFREEELQTERLRAHASALEASVVQAKLDALQMQLNPHFLFNTLNAVSGLIGRGRNDDAQEMLGKLGDLLRNTLNKERAHLTTVTKELDLLRNFLYIEQVRFGDRLSVEVHVEPSAEACAIPTMLLQPLVENAVRHGIEPTLQPGIVSVDVRRNNGDLIVRIEDSGRGLPSANGRALQEGIGLSNTRARLQQLFGAKATLSIENRAGGGAAVAVRMPCLPASAVSVSRETPSVRDDE